MRTSVCVVDDTDGIDTLGVADDWNWRVGHGGSDGGSVTCARRTYGSSLAAAW